MKKIEENKKSRTKTKVKEKEKKPKKTVKKELPDKKAKSESLKKKYFEGTGRRKTAIARVRLFPLVLKKEITPKEDESHYLIGEKNLKNYFPIKELQKTVLSPLGLINCLGRFKVSIKVKGGGLASQAEAIRHGVSRALVLFNPDFRKKLKKAGYLKRDPRMRERKKFGLKRARRAPQWSKR